MSIKKITAICLTVLITLAATACNKAKPMSLDELKAQSGIMLNISREIDSSDSFVIDYDGSISISTTVEEESFFGNFYLTDDELYEIYTNAFNYSYEIGDVMLDSIDITSENVSNESILAISSIIDTYVDLIISSNPNPNTLYEAQRFTIIATPYGNYEGEEESCEIMLFQGESVTIGDVAFEVFFVDGDMVVLNTSLPLCTVNEDGSINIYDEHSDFSIRRGQSVQMAFGDEENGLIFSINQL